jgi:hypothetical protein
MLVDGGDCLVDLAAQRDQVDSVRRCRLGCDRRDVDRRALREGGRPGHFQEGLRPSLPALLSGRYGRGARRGSARGQSDHDRHYHRRRQPARKRRRSPPRHAHHPDKPAGRRPRRPSPPPHRPSRRARGSARDLLQAARIRTLAARSRPACVAAELGGRAHAPAEAVSGFRRRPSAPRKCRRAEVIRTSLVRITQLWCG